MLDLVSQEIVDAILEAQKIGSPGDSVVVPHTTAQYQSSRKVGMQELRRHRRDFIRVFSSRPPLSKPEIAKEFVIYLNSNS